MTNHLLAISIQGPTLDEYMPQRALDLWWTENEEARVSVTPTPQPGWRGGTFELSSQGSELVYD